MILTLRIFYKSKGSIARNRVCRVNKRQAEKRRAYRLESTACIIEGVLTHNARRSDRVTCNRHHGVGGLRPGYAQNTSLCKIIILKSETETKSHREKYIIYVHISLYMQLGNRRHQWDALHTPNPFLVSLRSTCHSLLHNWNKFSRQPQVGICTNYGLQPNFRETN